jgi:tetratricopeptide (TPR) repeat protein
VADLAFAVAGTPVEPSAQPTAFKVVDGIPPADAARAVETDADQLIALTLLTPVGGEVVVHRWVAEALADHQGDGVADRHLRARDMRWHRITNQRGGFDDLVEIARHLAAAGRTDDLVRFAVDTSKALRGELAVAAFLGEVLPSVPREHPDFLPLMDREQQALIATGNGAAAQTRVQEKLRVAQDRAEADPSNLGFQRDLSVVYERLGDLARVVGDAAAAVHNYNEGLEIRQRLARAEPGNLDFQYGLIVSYIKLGDLAIESGKTAKARVWVMQGLEIAQQLVQADPGNVDFQRSLSISYERLGDLARAARDAAAARDWYTQGLEIRQRLAQADSGNVQFQRDLSVSYERLGDVAWLDDDLPAAIDYYTRSLQNWERVIAMGSTDLLNQRGPCIPHERLGELALRSGDVDTARRCFTGRRPATYRPRVDAPTTG